MIKGNNYIAANKQTAINTTGEILSVGDIVGHQDTEVGTATIKSFEINEAIGEVKAITDKGYAHIDFISKFFK
jgi:hypothetical protein